MRCVKGRPGSRGCDGLQLGIQGDLIQVTLRRAEAVKKYLTDKGVAPNRVYTDGKGKTQPVTKPGDCRIKGRKALIACLQPDRRVGIEVSGTK